MTTFLKTYLKAGTAALLIMLLIVGLNSTHIAFAEDGGGDGGTTTGEDLPPLAAAASLAPLITPTPGCRDPEALNYVSVANDPWVQNTPSICTYGPSEITTETFSGSDSGNSNSPACPVSGGYYQEGDSGDGVKEIQLFLNKELGLEIPITGYYGPITESAVRAFQQKYFDVIIAPWHASGTTGRWYKLTAGTAEVLSGCKPTPVTLEGIGTIWDFSAVVQK